MKKPYKHAEMSGQVCKCGNKIKANITARKPDNANLDCFKCHRIKKQAKGNTIMTAREVRTVFNGRGDRIGRKKGIYGRV